MKEYKTIDLDVSPEMYVALNEEARKEGISLDHLLSDIFVDSIMKDQKKLVKELVDNIEAFGDIPTYWRFERFKAWRRILDSIDKVNEFILED